MRFGDWMGDFPQRGMLGQRSGFPATGSNPFQPMTGGNHPAMPGPMTGGYDSSGINPGGMYTGGQTGSFPVNPGGFVPMGGQFPPQPMTGGPLQAQSSYPQGLAGLFRGFSPYRFG